MSNNKFIDYANRLADLVILNTLWILFSLPLITAGATYSSFYYSIQAVVIEDQKTPVAAFLESFRRNFKATTLLHLLFAPSGMLFTFVLSNLALISNDYLRLLFTILSASGLTLVFLVQLHGHALLGYYNLSFQGFLSVLIRAVIQYPLQNLLLLVITAGSVWLIHLYPPLILGLPGLSILLNSIIQCKIYSVHICITDEQDSDM